MSITLVQKNKSKNIMTWYARGFVPLCENCENGLKDKITEVKA